MRYHVIQCRFALRTEERVLSVWDLPKLTLDIIVISSLRESYLSLVVLCIITVVVKLIKENETPLFIMLYDEFFYIIAFNFNLPFRDHCFG